MTARNVVIIGSGPAGVSAAFPLLDAGLAVTMLTAGDIAPEPPNGLDLWTLRTEDRENWQLLRGEDARVWAADGATSPKFRTPRAAAIFGGFDQVMGLQTRTMTIRGAMAVGGLSEIWGAGVAMFDQSDLDGTALDAGRLGPHYRTIARRIGISGADDDLGRFFGIDEGLLPPSPLVPAAEALFKSHYRRRSVWADAGVRLGRARNAVLTEPLAGRHACTSCALCLYGCGEGAIYSARFDVEVLRRRPGFTLVSGCVVTAIRSLGDAWSIEVLDQRSNARTSLQAETIVLAAGALGTAKLVRATLGLWNVPGPFLSNPTAAFGLWLPRLLGSAEPRRAFALAQLSLTMDGPSGQSDYAFGNLFQLSGLPVSEFLMRMPVTITTGRKVLRRLMPGMLVGNLFFPGRLSRHQLVVREEAGLAVEGAFDPEIALWLRDMKRRLRHVLLRSGAVLLPGGFALGEPGSDMHYAGTVPARRTPEAGQSDADGAVAGLPGIFAVDASVLPVLPAKPHTLTVMANACRIATGLAARLARPTLAPSVAS